MKNAKQGCAAMFVCSLLFLALSYSFGATETNENNQWATQVPLSIGNKWYYTGRGGGQGNSGLYGIRKEIIDTTRSGFRIVDVKELFADGVISKKEYWRYTNWRFYSTRDTFLTLDYIPLYDSTLIADTTRIYRSFEYYEFTWRYESVFGLNLRTQKRFAFIYSKLSSMYWTIKSGGTVGVFLDSIQYFSSSGSWFRHLKLKGASLEGTVFGDTNLTTTSVKEPEVELPLQYSLTQNYPNPFNPTTSIKYEIPNTNHVSLKVFDVLGREVAVLVNETKGAGKHEVVFDASDMASGIYFYRLRAGLFYQTRKMVLLQ